MSSETRVLQADAGVLLKEVHLRGDGGHVAVAYSVSSKRTPEVWNCDSLPQAKAAFDAEVALCKVI